MELRAEGLTKVYGDLRAVDSLSFSLGDGEIWGFIGPNGAGKTTTLRVLATLEHPTEGDAWVDGESVVRDADRVRPEIGFMPDYFGVYPAMLVSEYLDFFARAYGLRGRARTRAVAEIVEFTEIGDLLEKKVAALSRGMQQRISLGRALVHDPDLLLLDEPAAGLDPQARMDLRELLRLLATRDKTILISSHILADLEELVNNVLIIREGRLVYSGPPEDVHGDASRPLAVTVRVMGELRECSRLLLESPWVHDVQVLQPDRLSLQMRGGREAIAEIVATLVEGDHKPYQVVTEGRLLEKMYLEVTGEPGDETLD